MAANINDKFTEATNGTRPVPTTLTALLPSGASPGTATCGALTGWPTATAVHFIIYTIDVNGRKVSGSQTDWKGIVSGSTLTGLVLKAGTNSGYAIGAVVEAAPTAAWADDVVEGLDVEHNQDGTHDNTLVAMLAGAQTHTGVKTFNAIKFNSPQGYLINGQISRSVSSNNITVAIKTLAGTDPSATDPVYCRIGNTIRSITSALSVTKNAGTNWFDSGSVSLATYEIDYFVYLGYNATDGVVIGFSRIPFARVYSDFSATTTNDKYCAISTITTAAATDEYENIGRVNATLSGTASFNWSVPATSVIVNRPIFETRELTCLPVLTGSTTAPAYGNATLVIAYRIYGRECRFKWKATFGNTSTFGNGTWGWTLPISSTENATNDNYLGRFTAETGTGIYIGDMTYNSATIIGGLFHSITTVAQAAGRITHNAPVVWANTNKLQFVVQYTI